MPTDPILLYNRSLPTLARHLWVMGKLLSLKESTDNPSEREECLRRRIQAYVAATCYPKILRRMKNQTVSQSYIRSLRAVTSFDFNEAMRGEPTTREIANNRQLVLNYLLPIEKLQKTNNYPRLIEQAKSASNKNFQLYTEGTCVEFHQLLLDLIDRFRGVLDGLQNNRGTEKASTKGSKEFKMNAQLAMVCAYGLQRLATGAAIRMHLRTIAVFLQRKHSRTSMPISGEMQEEADEELDEDLKAVQPSVMKEGVEIPLWRSYVDWLRLMISHFDAVEILVRFVMGSQFHQQTISIQIIVAPTVDNQLLDWQQLFTEPTLFPISSSTDTLPIPLDTNRPNAYITNANLLVSLNNALTTCSVAKQAKLAWDNNDVNKTFKYFQKLESSDWPGWRDCIQETLAMLRPLDSRTPSDDFSRKKISEAIDSLVESAKFFNCLNNDQAFKGTLHCEACLASLLVEPTALSGDIPVSMEVSYISYLFLSPKSHCL